MSAFIYYSFNGETKNTPLSSSSAAMSSYTISRKSTMVTDRKSPVVFCKGGGSMCVQVWNYLPCFK